jgi:KUP system potassium uptake protein
MTQADQTEKTGVDRHEQQHKRNLLIICLATLGVVYGDIGTSPLYALRECFRGSGAADRLVVSPFNVLGVLSLIAWSLIIVISIKYLLYVMRADNKGEGGILALLALMERRGGKRTWFVLLSIFGAALLYGDGMITPAISVLSAVEGLKIARPGFERYAVPITTAILVLLFIFQQRGTKTVGLAFGPIMLLWFLTIGALGLIAIVRQPAVLTAFDPRYALAFFSKNGWLGFTVLGAVFLVVTGGEALYADLGHFGRLPIRVAWFGLVLPSLLLSYFGQGALVLSNGSEIEHPFFHLAPHWALYPLVALATCAAVIASQAIISGVFSLTRQAVSLNQFPRVEVIHTSYEEIGRVYLPAMNWLLMIGCIGLVWAFRSSSNLAGAYGVAVSATMAITTILAAAIARELWKWNLIAIGVLTAVFLSIDLAFFAANMLKFPQGGWFPLAVGAVMFILMTTWKRGHQMLFAGLHKMEKPFDQFLVDLARSPPVRVPGTSVFLTSHRKKTPAVLVHHLKHNKALSQKVLLLGIEMQDSPHIPVDERVESESFRHGFHRVSIKFGFMDNPDVPRALKSLKLDHAELDFDQITYYFGRQTPIPTGKSSRLPFWREKLFVFMNRNAAHAVTMLKIPPKQVVELGIEIEI